MAKRILFQGDSITDCGRARDDNPYTGTGFGYPLLVKAALGVDKPNAYEYINRGISGNRIVDVYARIKADIINLAPDYMSMFIGVNDVWHEIGSQNGVDTEKFEIIYTMLLDEVKAALPNLKLFLMAPFVVEGDATCPIEEMPDRFERFRTGVDEKIGAVKRVAEKCGVPCIELQPLFDEACKVAPPEYWTVDGVHPTAAGHELIKREWLKTFKAIEG